MVISWAKLEPDSSEEDIVIGNKQRDPLVISWAKLEPDSSEEDIVIFASRFRIHKDELCGEKSNGVHVESQLEHNPGIS